jgi:hypothetical protein
MSKLFVLLCIFQLTIANAFTSNYTLNVIWNNYYSMFGSRLSTSFHSPYTLFGAHQQALLSSNTSTTYKCSTYLNGEIIGETSHLLLVFHCSDKNFLTQLPEFAQEI